MAIKIPTYTSKGTITSETGGVTSNIKVSPFRTPAGALEPISNFVRDEYIKEKKLEADNKATQILNDLYVDQKNEQGAVVAKGLMTIQSEIKQNQNPTDASSLHDQQVNKLFDYAKNNKFQNLDNFTKKSLERKYYATAGILKVKALEGSRLKQIDAAKDIDEDLVSKETLVLKEVGPSYLPIYKDKVLKRINNNPKYDDGIKKILIDGYIKFGEESLASTMSVNQPYAFKDAVKKGQFDSLETKEIIKYSEQADKQILENNKIIFTSDLTLTENSTTNGIIQNYNEIKNGTFNGSIEKIKAWNSLPSSDKASILKFANTKRSSAVAEINQRNSAILNEKKDDAINDFTKIYKNSKSLSTLTLFKINNIIGEPRSDYEKNAKAQYVKLNEKIGLKEFNNKENFYKNFSIQKEILNGKITDHVTPFLLEGETEPKSIIERVGTQINKRELGLYINYLLPNKGNVDFIENHKQVYKIIEKYYPIIEGQSVLNYLDTTTDNRLSNFQSRVLFNFSQGIREGKEVSDLLDLKSKNFIAKNFQEFKPDKDALTKILSQTKQTNIDELQPPPWNPDKYKTWSDYTNSKEYKKYLKKKDQ